jgi:hypothetical protein
VRDHLHHRALDAHRGSREAPRLEARGGGRPGVRGRDDREAEEDAQRDEPHVCDRRIGDQLLHVLLHERHEADVDHGDQRQRDHEGVEGGAGIRGDRQREAQEAVAAHLQHDRGQDHRAAGRRLDVRIRQPGVDREHRHLHREGGEEGHEDPVLLGHRQRQLVEGVDVVDAGLRVHVDQRDQHEHRAEEGVQEELERRVDAPRAAPDADDQEHRDQHRLPEEVEQQRVERAEHADHQPFHDQERGQVLRRALLDRGPAGNHDRDRHQRRQQHEGHRDAVEPEMVAGAERRDPRQPLDELVGGRRHVETRPDRDRQQECGDRRRERDPARHGRLPIAERQHGGTAEDRQPYQHRE